MYEKEKIKSALDVYFNLVQKEDIRNEVDNLMNKISSDEVSEISKDPKYITAAVEAKDLEMARILYANGSILPTSLLKIAIDNFDIDMLNFLLDTGIDIEELVYDGKEYYEPIAYLAKKKDNGVLREIAEKMLKLGANPNAKIGNCTIIEYYLKYCDYVFFYVDSGLEIVSLFIENGAIFDSENTELSYYAAWKLDLNTFKTFAQGKYDVYQSIAGAIVGNNEDIINYILKNHASLKVFTLNLAISRNTSIKILNAILDFNIPKYQLKAEIEHLKNIKHKIEDYKYYQMLKALKRAKRKSK